MGTTHESRISRTCDFKEPSVLSYILHGWLNVYKAAGIKRVNDWIAMDAAAEEPCHDYQKTGPGIWYLSSLSVDPDMQGTGLGTKLIEYYESYIRERGGKQLVLVTNSRKKKRRQSLRRQKLITTMYPVRH